MFTKGKNFKLQESSRTIYFGLKNPTISTKDPRYGLIVGFAAEYGSHMHLASHVAAAWLLLQDPPIPTEITSPTCIPTNWKFIDWFIQHPFQGPPPCFPVLPGKWITESHELHYSHAWLWQHSSRPECRLVEIPGLPSWDESKMSGDSASIL